MVGDGRWLYIVGGLKCGSGANSDTVQVSTKWKKIFSKSLGVRCVTYPGFGHGEPLRRLCGPEGGAVGASPAGLLRGYPAGGREGTRLHGRSRRRRRLGVSDTTPLKERIMLTYLCGISFHRSAVMFLPLENGRSAGPCRVLTQPLPEARNRNSFLFSFGNSDAVLG